MSTPSVGDRFDKLFPDPSKCAQVLAAFSDLPSEKRDGLLLGNDAALKIALETLLTTPAPGASIVGLCYMHANAVARTDTYTCVCLQWPRSAPFIPVTLRLQ